MRKIIQITAYPAAETQFGPDHPMLFALCDDGSVWRIGALGGAGASWQSFAPIPQDEVEGPF